MYGSRPSNMDSLVVPSRDYYKYEELSDTNIEEEEEERGETTQSAEAVLAGEMRMKLMSSLSQGYLPSGYQNKVLGRNRNHGDEEVLAAVDAGLVERSGPGSCYQCSTLTDSTGLCQVRLGVKD